MPELQPDWCSPKRLQISPTTRYDFQGDRFIPSRSLMDLDQAHSLLTNRNKSRCNSSFGESYRKKLEEKLNLDSQGNPFRMLVFRGSPKSNRRSFRCIDEMRRDEAQELERNAKQKAIRRVPKRESMILDAPNIKNDFYMNIMDWGKNNILAVALGSQLYLWNPETRNVVGLLNESVTTRDYPTSVAWSRDAKTLAVGYQGSNIQLWDGETFQLVRSFGDHTERVAAIAWNGNTLTSGSKDKSIINHDARAGRNVTSRVEQAHKDEVCGLKWSEKGRILASGGNDNLLYLWECSKMSSSSFLHRFDDHTAAVKALAWCPNQPDLLASGGGTRDGTIKIWNTQKGVLVNSLDTHAQVCGLEWNRHHKELLSGHGFTASEPPNQMCLWRYPSMTKVGDFKGHSSRILHLSQSPDGLTVVSAGADETLRFWETFGPPCREDSKLSELDGFLSLKISPMR